MTASAYSIFERYFSAQKQLINKISLKFSIQPSQQTKTNGITQYILECCYLLSCKKSIFPSSLLSVIYEEYVREQPPSNLSITALSILIEQAKIGEVISEDVFYYALNAIDSVKNPEILLTIVEMCVCRVIPIKKANQLTRVIELLSKRKYTYRILELLNKLLSSQNTHQEAPCIILVKLTDKLQFLTETDISAACKLITSCIQQLSTNTEKDILEKLTEALLTLHNQFYNTKIREKINSVIKLACTNKEQRLQLARNENLTLITDLTSSISVRLEALKSYINHLNDKAIDNSVYHTLTTSLLPQSKDSNTLFIIQQLTRINNVENFPPTLASQLLKHLANPKFYKDIAAIINKLFHKKSTSQLAELLKDARVYIKDYLLFCHDRRVRDFSLKIAENCQQSNYFIEFKELIKLKNSFKTQNSASIKKLIKPNHEKSKSYLFPYEYYEALINLFLIEENDNKRQSLQETIEAVVAYIPPNLSSMLLMRLIETATLPLPNKNHQMLLYMFLAIHTTQIAISSDFIESFGNILLAAANMMTLTKYSKKYQTKYLKISIIGI